MVLEVPRRSNQLGLDAEANDVDTNGPGFVVIYQNGDPTNPANIPDANDPNPPGTPFLTFTLNPTAWNAAQQIGATNSIEKTLNTMPTIQANAIAGSSFQATYGRFYNGNYVEGVNESEVVYQGDCGITSDVTKFFRLDSTTVSGGQLVTLTGATITRTEAI